MSKTDRILYCLAFTPGAVWLYISLLLFRNIPTTHYLPKMYFGNDEIVKLYIIIGVLIATSLISLFDAIYRFFRSVEGR